MSEAACDLELWDCCSIGYCGSDHFTVAEKVDVLAAKLPQ